MNERKIGIYKDTEGVSSFKIYSSSLHFYSQVTEPSGKLVNQASTTSN